MIDALTIRNIVSDITHKPVTVGEADSLQVSKVLDSLSLIELIAHLEKTFNVTFAADELSPENLDSINAIVTLVESKRGGA